MSKTFEYYLVKFRNCNKSGKMAICKRGHFLTHFSSLEKLNKTHFLYRYLMVKRDKILGYVFAEEYIFMYPPQNKVFWIVVLFHQKLSVAIRYPEMLTEIFPYFIHEKLPEHGKERLWFLKYFVIICFTVVYASFYFKVGTCRNNHEHLAYSIKRVKLSK